MGAPTGLVIRPATVADLPAVFDIYNEQVFHGVATFDTEPRLVGRDDGWLTKRDPLRRPVVVAESGGRIVGWGSLSDWSEKKGYARTVENSVYVLKEARGGGVGRAIMEDLIRRAPGCGIAVITARIAAGAPESVAMHRSLGFREIGVQRRCGEKFGRLLDVVLMDLHLDEAAGAVRR